jgi:hypothetical protein
MPASIYAMDAAVDKFRSGRLDKSFLVQVLPPLRDTPVILENEAYFLWRKSAQTAFGTVNGKGNLINAVLRYNT